jgi:hypothetical protein
VPQPPSSALVLLLSSLARGGSFVVLGLTASLFLFTALPDLFTPAVRLGIHALAALLVLTGAWWWWRLPPLSTAWLAWSRQFLAAAVLQVYLVPFVGWWLKLPHVAFFAVNVLAAALGLGWLLCALGGMLAESGRAMGDRHLALEGTVSAVLSPLCIVVPVLYAAGRTAWVLHQSGLAMSWRALHPDLFLPSAVGAFLLFAPLFSLTVCVGARLRILRRIAELRRQAAFDRDTLPDAGLS